MTENKLEELIVCCVCHEPITSWEDYVGWKELEYHKNCFEEKKGKEYRIEMQKLLDRGFDLN